MLVSSCSALNSYDGGGNGSSCYGGVLLSTSVGNFVVCRICIRYCSLFTMSDAYHLRFPGNYCGGSPDLLRSLLRTFLSEESLIHASPLSTIHSKAAMQEQNEPFELATPWRLITQRTLDKVRLFHVKTSMVSKLKLAEGQ